MLFDPHIASHWKSECLEDGKLHVGLLDPGAFDPHVQGPQKSLGAIGVMKTRVLGSRKGIVCIARRGCTG